MSGQIFHRCPTAYIGSGRCVAVMTDSRYGELKAWLRERGSVVLAYSGGVDSALLAQACVDALPGKHQAFLADLPYLSARQRGIALDVAEAMGLHLQVIPIGWEEMSLANANDEERCYHCKSIVYSLGRELSSSLGVETLIDGENADDQEGERPGRRAAADHGVLSPLRELGIGRGELESMALALGIPMRMEKETCLATRIKGQPLSPELLSGVEEGEKALRSVCELRELRLRRFPCGHVVQVREEEMPLLLKHREAVMAALREVGINAASLSLRPYRSHGGAGER